MAKCDYSDHPRKDFKMLLPRTEDEPEICAEPKRIEEVIGMLRTLLSGDEREQRETFSFIRKALDEDRPSNRKLFPLS
jgi:hypothetical protein